LEFVEFTSQPNLEDLDISAPGVDLGGLLAERSTQIVCAVEVAA